MHWLKRALLIVILLLVALATLDFVLENQQPVRLGFLDMQSPELPLALLSILVFIIGSACGLFAGWLGSARLRLRLLRQGQELNRYRKEVDKLRTEPIKD